MTDKQLTPEILEAMTINELSELAKDRSIKNIRKLRKQELIDEILDFEKAMQRKVSVNIASSPRDSVVVPIRPMVPLAYGDPETEDDQEVYPDEIPEPVTGFPEDKKQTEPRPANYKIGFYEPRVYREPQKRIQPVEPVVEEDEDEADGYEEEPGLQPRPFEDPSIHPRGFYEDRKPYAPQRPRFEEPPTPPSRGRYEEAVEDEPPVRQRGTSYTRTRSTEEPPAPPVRPRTPPPPPPPPPLPPKPTVSSRVRRPEFIEDEDDRKTYTMPDKRDFDRYQERGPKIEEHIPASEDLEEPRITRTPERVRRTQITTSADGSEIQKGVLDIHPEGTYGFIRQKEFKFGEEDIYVSISQIKKFALRTGDLVEGVIRPPRDQERYKSLVKIERINGLRPEDYRTPKPFEKLIPVYPDQRLFLESDQYETSTRLLDLFSPIGRGQRCIIVAKPKAGKTVMLKKIAAAIAKNHPEVELIALLIDERPEEVTDFERNIDGMVISSTFDEKPENHIQTAELTIEYAKRRVEQGKDVMILLDSLTRLARSYNLTCPPSGKTLSGGLDPNSLYKPKRFLGAARNIEHGGSLTIISSALIETGSRLDDIIYEEFKGTANSEIHLIRELADKRIFPAVDLLKSGTRHEELLYNAEEMECLWQLRKMIAEMDEAERMSRMINQLLKTKKNVDLLVRVQKAVDSNA
jgi:transcription termination factor Rho